MRIQKRICVIWRYAYPVGLESVFIFGPLQSYPQCLVLVIHNIQQSETLDGTLRFYVP